MQLHLLGTTGYHPNARRHTACLMLPEQGIVLDAGTGMFRVRSRLKTRELDIFLTHAHLDHVVGLTYLFDTLVKSQSLVAQILDADKQAAAGLAHDANNRLVYDDGYYTKMDRRLRPMLQQRLADTVNGVASVIAAAWDEAGRPGGR